MNRRELIKALKELIEYQKEVGGDYDTLYFGIKELIENE
tara:strand:+ start:344 stop:460 length:117 start_codon:yes stop_codon:yes gene_type:complete